MQNDFVFPSASTTTWLCSHRTFGYRSSRICLERSPSRSIRSSSIGSKFRSIRYLGMSPPPRTVHATPRGRLLGRDVLVQPEEVRRIVGALEGLEALVLPVAVRL